MNNLKKLRKEKGLGQVEMAKKLDIGQSTYSRYESGVSDIPTDILSKMADFFGVSTDIILGREEDPQPIGRPIVVDYKPVLEAEVPVPLVASLRCGFGEAGEPFTVIGEKKVPASFVERWGREIVLNEAIGSSMIPTILPHEFMVCYPGDWWDDGMVVIVNVNDSDTVKRIYHAEDGGIDLVPDNPRFKAMHYSPKDIEDLQIQVLAHVLTTLPQEIHPIPRRVDPS